jgi:Family of unknown function (DUF5691)
VKEWEGLVATALLGTQRRVVEPGQLPESVRSLVGGDDPEHVLLSAAAALAGYRKAGRLPVRDVTLLPSAVEDERPMVGRAAARRLVAMLYGDHGYQLAEWLEAVRRKGLRVPPERLPALADAARGRSELRAAVAQAAGPRGPWLANLRPEWEFLADQAEDDPRVWELGTTGQRLTWLSTTRQRDPERALAAITEVWSSEPAPVRTRFLGILRTGLSTADETFLEQALDDRAKDVRALAAELLAELPDSALSGRMAARLRPLLAISHGTLNVDLPADCDEGMRRDGVNPKPPAGVGQRAWWLGQLISLAPLATWAELGSPSRLVRMPVEGADPRLLTLGWSTAAIRERNAEWVLALLDGDTALPPDRIAAMVASLPKERWARVVARLTRDRLQAGLFQALPAPWPADLGRYVLDRLATHRDERAVAHVADIAARAVPPECLDHPLAHAEVDFDMGAWRRRLIFSLAFRREMYEELA